jgi:hypothetical protein
MALEPPVRSEAPFHQGLGAVAGAGAPCARHGCQGAAHTTCGYVDGAGQRCGAALCAAHSVTGLCCPRHAAIAAWLNSASATLRPHRPSVSDRTASLLLGLGAEIEPQLVGILREHNAGHPGVEAGPDGLAELRRADGLAWEFGWSAYTSAGHLDHVAIRVGAGEPPRVRLLVNQNEVFAEVPYWITRRLTGGAADSRDHQMFADRLLGEARRALDAAHAAISWLPAS